MASEDTTAHAGVSKGDKYFEVVYEDGSYSLLYGTQEEVLSGLQAQHERAKSGEQAGPAGGPAIRVKRLFEYSTDPADVNADGTLTKDEIKEIFKDLGEVINVHDLINALRAAVEPLVPNAAPHDSKYKMPEDSEVDLAKAGIE